MTKRKSEAFITEEQMRARQAKEWLKLKEAALLLNVSLLRLKRGELMGKMQSEKKGKKHLLNRKSLMGNYWSSQIV